MRKFICLIITLFIAITANATTLKTGISIEQMPKALYGTWRVNAKLDTTNAPSIFKPQSADIWNMTRTGNKITLENPLSGANAEISVQTIEGNLVVFSKRLPYNNNKFLTDTITIRINENEFSGINTLTLESYSLIDNHLMKTETATYHIKGEKISGSNVIIAK